MDRLSERLALMEKKLDRIDNLERTLERVLAQIPSNIQIPGSALKFLKSNLDSFPALQEFIKDGPGFEEKVGARFSDLITNAKSARKKQLIPKPSSNGFLPSMANLDEWTRTMFDLKDEPSFDQLARAAFLRFFRDHGHLLLSKMNGPAPCLNCTCTEAYEHLHYLENFNRRLPKALPLIVASFSKKTWLSSTFWREFDRAIDEVYSHPEADLIAKEVIQIDQSKYTCSFKSVSSTASADSNLETPSYDKPARRLTDNSVASSTSSSFAPAAHFCHSPMQTGDNDWEEPE
eukprot:jgi/Hompol1/305/HPOL_003381-RA